MGPCPELPTAENVVNGLGFRMVRFRLGVSAKKGFGVGGRSRPTVVPGMLSSCHDASS